MRPQIITLLAVTDSLLAHVGRLKNHDGSTPATHWVPTLNDLLDLRSILMKERDLTAQSTTPTTAKKANTTAKP